MSVRMRRLASFAAVLGLAGLIGVAGVAPASAFILPPAPVSFPGSAVPANNNLTPAQYNNLLGQSPGLVPTKATPGAAAVKLGVTGVAGAATAVGGFQIGASIGSGIAAQLGVPTSGDVLCDLGEVLGNACTLGQSPTYTPDSDVAESVPGYDVQPPVVGINGNTGWDTNGGSMTLGEPSTAPTFGQAGTLTVTFPLSLSGACTVGAAGGWAPMLRVFFYTQQGGSYSDYPQYFGGPLGVQCANPQGDISFSWTPPAGHTFDHLTFSNANNTGTAGGAGTVQWYPEGHTDRPPVASPHPDRTWRTTWECSVGAGGATSSPVFREGDPTWPAIPQPTPCAQGVMTALTVDQMTGSAVANIYTWQLPAEVGATSAAYPECSGSTACLLVLERLASPESTATVSCFSSPELCTEWWAETSAGTAATEDTEYRCRYGTNPVPLSDCAVYSQAFKSGVYADPRTGEAPTGSPAPEPADNACPPPFTWTSLVTPWWYYKGAACAIEKAFVPTRSTATLARMQTALDQSAPVVWVAAFSEPFTGWSITGSGCRGPGFELWDVEVYVFSACEAPMQNIAAVTKAFATVAVSIFGGYACLRGVLYGFSITLPRLGGGSGGD